MGAELLEFDAPFADKVVVLTNFLPPYRIAMFEHLQAKVADLQILLSVPMESNRHWKPEWGILHVTVQKNIQYTSRTVHPNGFREESAVHIPYDTLPRLLAYRPRAIIAAEFGARTLQAAIYRLFFRRCRLLVWATISEETERGRGRLRVWLRKLILKIADGVLVNGSSGVRYIHGLGYPRHKIHTVPQATEQAPFRAPATRSSADTTRLLYVGQLIERKGLQQFHEHLVRWCETHTHRKVRWTIIGSGPLSEAIQAWERPANYDLQLLHEVPYAEIPGHYHAADLFAFPTFADEWGLVVNEALIAGLPVLGSVFSQAVEDLVKDGVNGWTFRPDHADELARALDRALESTPEQLDMLRTNAVESIAFLDHEYMSSRILHALNAVNS